MDPGGGTSHAQRRAVAGEDHDGRTRRPDKVFKWIALIAAACLAAFIAFVVVRGPTKPAAVGSAPLEVAPPSLLAVGTTAPVFSLPNLQGGAPVTLSAFRGRPVIVNFFASWCRDCRAELGAVASVARTYAGHVAVVGVDSNDTSEIAAGQLLAAAHATYPVAVDAHASVATQYLIQALPVSYFLNPAGRIVGSALGPQTVASLEGRLRKLGVGR